MLNIHNYRLGTSDKIEDKPIDHLPVSLSHSYYALLF